MPTVAERAEKTWTPEEIRGLRTNHGWSIRKAAALVGVTYVMLYYWEKGTHRPRRVYHILFDLIESGNLTLSS